MFGCTKDKYTGEWINNQLLYAVVVVNIRDKTHPEITSLEISDGWHNTSARQWRGTMHTRTNNMDTHVQHLFCSDIGIYDCQWPETKCPLTQMNSICKLRQPVKHLSIVYNLKEYPIRECED